MECPATYGDDELPLLDTALLIARDEYPHLDAAGYEATLQSYADDLKPRLERGRRPAGNPDDDQSLSVRRARLRRDNHQYDDPRNSYLNEVFDRKLGIPISLAVVQID